MRRALIVFGTLAVVASGIALVEYQPPFPTARLIICLSTFVFFAVAAWAAPARLRNGLVVVSSIVFGLAVIEGATLALGLRPKIGAADAGISHARPIVGWGPTQPGVFKINKKDADGRLIYDVKVTIDENLNRKTIPSQGPGPIAFFGDSFIFGDGVDDEKTLPQTFANLNQGQIPVLNLAFSGWSPAQNLAALQADLYGPLLDRPRHFILFTSPFHIERTACKGAFSVSTAPRYVLDGGAIRRAAECAGWRTRLLAPVFKFAQGFAVFQRASALAAAPKKVDVETYIKLIETFVATAQQKYNVKTTVLFWPNGDTPLKGTGYTEGDILRELHQSHIDILIERLPSMEEDGIYRIVGDGHPTALANETVAHMLQAHLRTADPQVFAKDEDLH